MKRLKELLFLIGIITIVFVGMLWEKNIYPFGDLLLRYYDMEQQVAAMYYHLWDVLHGVKSLYFDWYGAMGGNMSMTVSSYSFLSPFSLILYFVPREKILESLPFLIYVKILAAGICMHFYLTYRYRLENIWNIGLSFLYAFCGFCIVHFCFCPWLDVYAIFPIVMLGFYRLMKEGKPILYISFLTMTLIMSYYLGAMILLYIFLLGGLYLFLMEKDKHKRGEKALLLGVATLAAVGCAAFCLLPALYQTSIAARSSLKEKKSLLQTMIAIYTNTTLGDMRRWWSISNMSLCIVAVLIGFVKNLKYGKENIYMMLRVLMIGILLPMESINLIWHFGSYVEYPIRCGFIFAFALVTSGAYYLEKEKSMRLQVRNKELIILTAISVFVCMAVYWIANRTGFYGADIFRIHKIWIGILLCMIVIHIFLHQITFSWKKYLILISLVLEVAFTSYLIMGENNLVVRTKESNVAFVDTVNRLRKELPLEADVTCRIKNSDTTLNTNYPFVMGRSALSQWTNGVSQTTQEYASKWGYTIQFTRVTDYGGTIFSDALFHITQTISTIPLSEGCYRRVDSMEDYGLYQNIYQLPFGMMISRSDIKQSYEDMDYVELQNSIYGLLTGKEELLHTIVKNGNALETGAEVITENGKCKILFHTEKSGMVYLKAKKDGQAFQINLNGEDVLVPEMGDKNNTRYPAEFNNNVVCLGEIKPGKQEIILTNEDEAEIDVSIGELNISYLNYEDMKLLCSMYENQKTSVTGNKNGLIIYAEDAEEGEGLLIPVPYDKGFRALVNGKNEKITSVAGLFMEIPLEPGKNQIQITYRPPYLFPGVIISIVFAVGTIGFLYISRSRKHVPEIMNRSFYYLYTFLFGFFIIIAYILPIILLPYALYLNH